LAGDPARWFPIKFSIIFIYPRHCPLSTLLYSPQCQSSPSAMLPFSLKVVWLVFAALGRSYHPSFRVPTFFTQPIPKVSQRRGSYSSRLLPSLGPTGPPSYTASRSPSLRSRSASVRRLIFPSPFCADPPLATRHGVADDTFQDAAFVLRHTDRDHRSVFPHSDWRVRVLYLGLVPNSFQAVQLNTGISIVRFQTIMTINGEG
jgi:hypothetical protein